MNENQIASLVVDAAFRIHTKLGPGLLETVYEVILAHELRKHGLRVERQVPRCPSFTTRSSSRRDSEPI